MLTDDNGITKINLKFFIIFKYFLVDEKSPFEKNRFLTERIKIKTPPIQNKPEPNYFHVQKPQLKPVTDYAIVKTFNLIDELKGPDHINEKTTDFRFKKYVNVEENNGNLIFF
jgi:hypothetical protein